MQKKSLAKSWPYPKYFLVILGLSFFFGFVDIVSIGLALPKLVTTFHISLTTANYAITTSLIGYIIGAIVVSIFADHFGRKPALIMALLLFSIGSLLCGLSASFDDLLFWRFVTGLGLGAQIAISTTYASEMAPEAARGKIVSIMVACGMFGFAMLPFLAYALVPNFSWGWRGLFIFGAIGGFLALAMWKKLPDTPLWLQSKTDQHTPLKTLLQKRTVFYILLFATTWFIYYIGNYAWLTLSATLLVQHGFALGQSLFFVGLTSVGFIIGSLISIWLGDRFARKKMCAGTALIWAIALLVVGFIPNHAAIIIGGLIASATIATLIPQMYTLTAEQFPTAVRSTCIAVTDGLGHLGGAFCGQITFFVAHLIPQLAFFKAVLLAMAVTGVITALMLFVAKNKTMQALD